MGCILAVRGGADLGVWGCLAVDAWGRPRGSAMAKTRRYSIEVKDAKTKALVLSVAVDWTNDEKQLALSQMFRRLGIADTNNGTARIGQLDPANRNSNSTA